MSRAFSAAPAKNRANGIIGSVFGDFILPDSSAEGSSQHQRRQQHPQADAVPEQVIRPGRICRGLGLPAGEISPAPAAKTAARPGISRELSFPGGLLPCLLGGGSLEVGFHSPAGALRGVALRHCPWELSAVHCLGRLHILRGLALVTPRHSAAP